MLDEDLLFSDLAYVEQKVIEYMEAAFKKIVFDHTELAFETLVVTLKHHLGNANKALWEKNPDDISLKDIHKVLTKKVPKK